MDQAKMGKFIAELRKEHHLTQEQFAEKLKVDRSTISKWERGISFPDISLLQPICEIFNISINDFFNFRKQACDNSDNVKMIEAMNFYNKNSKIKYFRNFLIVFIIVIAIFLISMFAFEYNKYDIFEISTDTENFSVSGYYLKNSTNQILFIKEIDYNDIYVGTTEELRTTKLKIELTSNETLLYSAEINKSDEEFIDVLLENVSFYYDSLKAEESNGSKNLVDSSNLYLTIEVYDSNSDEYKAFYVNLIVE